VPGWLPGEGTKTGRNLDARRKAELGPWTSGAMSATTKSSNAPHLPTSSVGARRKFTDVVDEASEDSFPTGVRSS